MPSVITPCGGGGGGGIQFDTRPQVGTYLEVTTTGAAPTGDGIRLAASGGDITIEDTGDDVNISGDGLSFAASGNNGIVLTTSGAGNIVLDAGANSGIDIGGNTFGFMHFSGSGIRLLSAISISANSSGADTSSFSAAVSRDADLSFRIVGKGGVYSGIAVPGYYHVLPDDSRFELRDPFDSPIFQIDNASGSVTYHILTGATWQADL
jgi:hypothetical protein